MTYTLYGDFGSGHVSVEAALIEAGLAYRFERVRLDRHAQRQAAYLAVNPLGRLPSLVLPDGAVVAESVACLLALADRHEAAGLLPPKGSNERAMAFRWLLFAAANLYDAVGQHDYPERFTTDPHGAVGVQEAARKRMREHWLLLEEHLAPEPSGQRVGLLELYLATLASWQGCVGKGWIAQHCPKVTAVRDAVWGRPGLRALWLSNLAPLERARPDDLQALGALTEAAFAPWVPIVGRRPAPMDTDLRPRIEAGEVRVLRDGQVPVAALVARRAQDRLEIDSIAVSPGAQGRGIATRLLAEMESEANGAGLGRIALYTNAAMERNVALWRGLGFSEMDRRREDGFERVFFELRLDPGGKVWSD